VKKCHRKYADFRSLDSAGSEISVISDICYNVDCEFKTCLKRHPNPCKFFFGRRKCKFKNLCAYSHRFLNESDTRSKDKDLKESEIEVLEKEIEKIKHENEKVKQENDALKNKIDDLNDSMAKIQEYLQIILKEKEDIKQVNEALIRETAILNENLKILAESSRKCEATEKKTVEDIQEVQGSIETSVNFNLLFAHCFPCTKFKFNTKSEEGLQTHVEKKHKFKDEMFSQDMMLFEESDNNPTVSHMPIVAGWANKIYN
jgi:cell division protein FtsB